MPKSEPGTVYYVSVVALQSTAGADEVTARSLISSRIGRASNDGQLQRMLMRERDIRQRDDTFRHRYDGAPVDWQRGHTPPT